MGVSINNLKVDEIKSVDFVKGNERIMTINGKDATIDSYADYHQLVSSSIPSWISVDTTPLDTISSNKDDLSEEEMEKIFKYIADKFNKVPTVDHKCHNCGAVLRIDMSKHIFNCPYCESVYAIGTQNIYDFI